MLSGLAPRGSVMGPAYLIAHGLGEVPQRLLLDHLAPGSQPAELSARLGELSAVFRPARRERPAWTPPQVLLARQVPHEPGVCAVGSQRRLLRGRGYSRYLDIDSNVTATTDKMGKWEDAVAPSSAGGDEAFARLCR